MRELMNYEIDNVSGGDNIIKTAGEYVKDIGQAVGKAWAWATKMQLEIDSKDNSLLGAMSQGA